MPLFLADDYIRGLEPLRIGVNGINDILRKQY